MKITNILLHLASICPFLKLVVLRQAKSSHAPLRISPTEAEEVRFCKTGLDVKWGS